MYFLKLLEPNVSQSTSLLTFLRVSAQLLEYFERCSMWTLVPGDC